MAEDTEYAATLARINAVFANPDRYEAAERFTVAGHQVTVFQSRNPRLKPFYLADYAPDVLTNVRPTALSAQAYKDLAALASEFRAVLAPVPKPAPTPLKQAWPAFEPNDPSSGFRKGELYTIVSKIR